MPIPLDLGMIERDPSWQENFAWPLSQRETQLLIGGVMRNLTSAVRDITDIEAARLAELAAPRALNIILPALHAVGVISSAKSRGLRLSAVMPELRYMLGQIKYQEISTQHIERQLHLPVRQRFDFLRQIARPRYWTPWWRIPAVLTFPTLTAVNPNDMLEDRVDFSNERANFLDAAGLVHRSLGYKNANTDQDKVDIAFQAICSSATPPPGISPTLESRYWRYVHENVRRICNRSATMMSAMCQVKRLPQRIWCGSTGNQSTALVASEVLRRGGEVVGFDHVTGRGLERNIEFTALLELPFCTTFTTATEGTAMRLRALNPGQFVHARHKNQIIGNHGYPRVRALDLLRHNKRANLRHRRITYVSPIFRGWRQSTPASPADPVQLDWELRLVGQLKTMPINLTCQPHPEGILEGQVHPLARIATVKGVCFEELLADTDVFLFDWIRTSTFWIALCTDRPIVLIEPGYSLRDEFFTEEIREQIEARVIFISARNDERNRLTVETNVLRDALISAPKKVDGSFFRSLLAGWE